MRPEGTKVWRKQHCGGTRYGAGKPYHGNTPIEHGVFYTDSELSALIADVRRKALEDVMEQWRTSGNENLHAWLRRALAAKEEG